MNGILRALARLAASPAGKAALIAAVHYGVDALDRHLAKKDA